MICAMASGFERMLLSLSSNSAMASPAFPYFCTALLMRSISAAPSGLCIIRLIMSVSWAGLPLAAAWAACWSPAPRSPWVSIRISACPILGLHQGAEGGGVAFELFGQLLPSWSFILPPIYL